MDFLGIFVSRALFSHDDRTSEPNRKKIAIGHTELNGSSAKSDKWFVEIARPPENAVRRNLGNAVLGPRCRSAGSCKHPVHRMNGEKLSERRARGGGGGRPARRGDVK